jgi:hypothetical protein
LTLSLVPFPAPSLLEYFDAQKVIIRIGEVMKLKGE